MQERRILLNEKDDGSNGHEYIEIGGLKWSTMSIGASSSTDYGLLFQWADTEGYTIDQVGTGSGKKYFEFNTTNYKYCRYVSGSHYMTKYSASNKILAPEDDAAQVLWGGNWKMPTPSQIQNLINSTTATYSTLGNKRFVILTDKTDSSKKLYIPCIMADGGTVSTTSNIFFWSNTFRGSGNYDKAAQTFTYDSRSCSIGAREVSEGHLIFPILITLTE